MVVCVGGGGGSVCVVCGGAGVRWLCVVTGVCGVHVCRGLGWVTVADGCTVVRHVSRPSTV